MVRHSLGTILGFANPQQKVALIQKLLVNFSYEEDEKAIIKILVSCRDSAGKWGPGSGSLVMELASPSRSNSECSVLQFLVKYMIGNSRMHLLEIFCQIVWRSPTCSHTVVHALLPFQDTDHILAALMCCKNGSTMDIADCIEICKKNYTLSDFANWDALWENFSREYGNTRSEKEKQKLLTTIEEVNKLKKKDM